VIATEASPIVDPETAAKEQRLHDDYSYYAENLLRIIDKQANLVPLKRNAVQKIIAEIKADIKARGRRVRMYILKGRQFGISTDQLGENFHRTSTNFNKTALFVAHEPGARTHLFDVVKRMHNNIPDDLPEWKPPLKKSNAKELAFEGMESAIRVGVAGEENTGSGQTINYLHLSELPKYPANTVDQLLTSLFQAVPQSDPDSEIVAEGTANGVGGAFYDGFWDARYTYEGFLRNGKPAWCMSINNSASAENDWASVFLPWFLHDEYEMDPEPGFIRTDDERTLVKTHGINDSKLQWRRWCIINKCRGSREVFEQEYATTARGAFLTSGRPVFDVMKCYEKIKSCPKPLAFYDCITSIGQFIAKKPQVEGDNDGLLQVWGEPVPGAPYVIDADVSEGIEIGKSTDFHAVDVTEQLTGRQVAHWHGKCEPVQLGILLSHIGYRYNTAWIVPERNNHGTAVVGKLSELKYKNLYGEETPNPPHRPVMRYGWLTRGGKMGDAKALVIDNLVELVNKGMDGIVCADTFREMVLYKHNADGSMGAERGCFDDRVMAYAIGQWVRKRLPLPSTVRAQEGSVRRQVVPAGGLV